MQEVYRDGTLGTVKDYKSEILKELLKIPNVDHVRVFNRDEGNKVGIPEIEEKQLKLIVEKKLIEREQRTNILNDYKILTTEFDKKLRITK